MKIPEKLTTPEKFIIFFAVASGSGKTSPQVIGNENTGKINHAGNIFLFFDVGGANTFAPQVTASEKDSNLRNVSQHLHELIS